MKPEGYPFLRISKQYGVDYSVVLKVADDLKNTGRANFADLVGGSAECAIDIADATNTQQLIRNGVIDWQTGESVIPDDLSQELPIRN